MDGSFLHRPSGVLEPRGRFTLSGRQSFLLNLSGELRSAERGDSPPPRRGKRVDTKVSTLLTPTSFWEGLTQIADM